MSPASLFWTVAGLCCLLGSRQGAHAQYGYNYDLNYYDDYSLYTAGLATTRLALFRLPLYCTLAPLVAACLARRRRIAEQVCAYTGYHYDMYDEEDEGFYFNPYTGSYDDVYGDYFFDDVEEEEVSTCRLAEDGKPKFEGGKILHEVHH